MPAKNATNYSLRIHLQTNRSMTTKTNNKRKIRLQSRHATLAVIRLPLFGLLASSASAATLAIVNGGFETGTDGSATISGWTTTAGATGFWLQDGTGGGSFPQDPSAPQAGSFYLTANRLAGGAGSQPASSTLSQTVGLDPTNLALAAAGTAQISLNFFYHDTDFNDSGTVTLSFLDGSSTLISSITTGTLANIAGNGTAFGALAPWTSVTLGGPITGAVPMNTAAVRISITTNRIGGSATNVHFDSFSAQIIPEPSAAVLGLVGTLGLLRRRR